MVVDICLGITEKLVRQILVGRKLVDFYLTDVPGSRFVEDFPYGVGCGR